MQCATPHKIVLTILVLFPEFLFLPSKGPDPLVSDDILLEVNLQDRLLKVVPVVQQLGRVVHGEVGKHRTEKQQ